MKSILVNSPTHGAYQILVDDADYKSVSWYKWYLVKMGKRMYARRAVRTRTGQSVIYLHQCLLNAPPGMEIDHKDGNGLNNQRANLRIVRGSQNCMNKRKRFNSTSRYKGVTWAKDHKCWRAQIRVEGTLLHLGYFHDEKNAGIAYDSAALKYFGEYAHINLPNRKDQA